jgi:DNA-binding response OmpR family regulator
MFACSDPKLTIAGLYFRMKKTQMSDQKILIVDYDAKSLESMTDLFSGYKLEILTAADGVEAYEKYKSEKPNLILLEAMLPKLHGFDLTQKIYKETKGRIPVVIVTGLYKGTQYRNEAIRSFGAAEYFEKPFDNEKLVKSVLNLLHDELDIQEDLPDPESVLKLLSDDD